MEQRGIGDLVKALTILSAGYALYDIATRAKSVAAAKAEHEQTKARLGRIEKSVKSLHAKLGG